MGRGFWLKGEIAEAITPPLLVETRSSEGMQWSKAGAI